MSIQHHDDGAPDQPEAEASPVRKSLLAKVAVLPTMRHAAAARQFGNSLIGDDQSEWKDTVDAYGDVTKEVAQGDLARVSETLMAQALTLDSMFTQFASRAANNMGEHPQAFERYARLALKAQANSRATLEAIARIHQPREQIVKHVTVHEGGQAVVADQFHHHAHGGQNEKSRHQPYRTDAAGAVAPLLGENTAGNGVPISSDAERALQDSRREVAGRAEG